MAFPYRKILCPLDFTENSLVALDKAFEIARHFDAALMLVRTRAARSFFSRKRGRSHSA